jgi:hypothetical protein
MASGGGTFSFLPKLQSVTVFYKKITASHCDSDIPIVILNIG